MWNAYTVLFKKKPLDSFSFLSHTHFSSDAQSNNRPVSGQTKLGSISIHFQGAATAVRERVRVEKEWGDVCVW